MLTTYLRRYRSMILSGILFFYLGCGITLSLLKMDCAEVTKFLREDDYDNVYSPRYKVEYAVVILSSIHNVEERDNIRSTWKNLARNIVTENGRRIYKWNTTLVQKDEFPEFIKFYFVMAVQYMNRDDIMALMSEHERTNDIIMLENVQEGYKYLSEKILRTMEWFSNNLKNLKYLIKCDDDSFVRIDLIVRDLEKYAPSMNSPDIAEYVSYKHNLISTKGLYWGYFNGHARVYLSGKWQEQKWFLCDNYLPYALGGGYVISRNIVHYIAKNSEILSPYHSEDVSMGVWTAALRDINRVHDIRFDTEWKSRGCSDDMLVRHKQNITEMTKMFANLALTNGKKLCTVKTEIRKTYRYKWDVLPSGCCK